ncbi:HEAT repeat protein [Purpureocillium lavendulum]|uniref:HEAT repeat protein n=1 Tax=Purpureocillium lavendulum TaxID=1247861 RepID=A0AB34G177_9HYPO|nr:HEAT repeat protein [Purpureocillium lavendulum]
MAATQSQDRNELFQKLKPCCIRISQIAIREEPDPAASRGLVDSTNELLAILEEQAQQNSNALDEKLAEYIFFPLYHIFRRMGQYPILLVENCVKCLQVLITYGWRSKLSSKLAQQILSLLVFIIDGVPGTQERREVPEETVLETFRAQAALFNTAATSLDAASGLADQESIPILGHAITVMLQGATDGANTQIQIEALRSLRGVYSALREQEALANFLPGIVSSLTKMLSAPTRYKTAVLAAGIETLQLVLTRVLGDLRTRGIAAQESDRPPDDDDDKGKVLTSAWLQATTSQVKLALSTVVKLRTQDATKIQEALERLCITLLDECHTSLNDCTNILIETAIILDDADDSTDPYQTTLRHLANIYPELAEVIKGTVYNWMSSLPRITQVSDDDSKVIAVHNLSKGITLLQNLGVESGTLEDSITASLKDSMISLVQSSPHDTSPATNLQLLESPARGSDVGNPDFEQVLLTRQSQKALRKEFLGLLDKIGSATQKTMIAENLMETVRESSGADQLASMWLCYELIKASNASSAATDAFLDLSLFAGSSSDDTEAVFHDLYDFSVQILDAHTETDDVDWRLEALAMEVTAYAAHKSGMSFRPELIDVLFPVATFLGSDNANLREHAIATLNSIATSSQYRSVSDLIVDNVDYMVNSVALRLNTLDVSPASMQVLLMMIRLAGPRLIPFMDDVVDSIFSALENYHGYTSFVESLFSVLKEVVDQASRTEQRLLTDSERTVVDHRKKRPTEDGLDSLLDYLDKRAERKARDAAERASWQPIEGHPKAPWADEAAKDGDEHDEGPPPSEEKPPNSPTYQLLLRIATLTQHYLTSPTPKLRRSLLELLTTASTILAGDEDSFLPLVNAVWPVVIGRLYDSETFVTIEACHALAGLCKAAGDFLSSRFKTEWGDGLRNWCRKAKERASASASSARTTRRGDLPARSDEKGILIPIKSGDTFGANESVLEIRSKTSGSLGEHASPARVWEAVVQLLTAIVSYVRIDDEMFDDMLGLLSDVMERDKDVMDALETINADAVWLARYERGNIEPLPTPKLDGFEFAPMVQTPRG